MSELKDFIDQDYLESLIKENRKPSRSEVLDGFEKGEEKRDFQLRMFCPVAER